MKPKKCAFCGKEFIPTKNDERIKYCCADCRISDRNKNKYSTQWTRENRERVIKYRQSRYEQRNAKRRQQYAENEKLRELYREKARQWHRNNPEKKKDQQLRENFGISLVDYQELLAKQDGKCAICGSATSKAKSAKYLYVDHDHNTGEIRGLLCNNCNFALGHFNDNVNLLLKAIQYLRGDYTGKMVDMVQSKRRTGRSGKSF